MNIETKKNKKNNFERMQWLVIFILLTMAVSVSFLVHNIIWKTLIIICILIITARILIMTYIGQCAILFIREAHTELRKVVWPTYSETLHITFIVITVTAVMSLILWGIDSILIYIISFITTLRF